MTVTKMRTKFKKCVSHCKWDEMEKSREHELKLFQLTLGNRANSGMPPSSSMDTGFYTSMPSSLGAQQTTKERMSEGSYGNPFLYGNGKYQTL